jgi:zinc protease
MTMARGLRACVLSLTLAPAVTAAEGARFDVPYQTFRLDNGLTVIVHEDHSVPIATVNTWFRVGSSRERAGRTGLAHLFEHLMFEGSKHVAEGAFDRLLESVGGSNNATTSPDRTNYYDDIPASALDLALFLESDRMRGLLDTMTPQRVDGQRDVVKNERRESFENTPYGMAPLLINESLYPPGHPYHWPLIGYMEDLTAATHEDIADFFRRYYSPGNASLVIAGDVDPPEVRTLVEKWYGDIPAAAAVPPLGTQPVVLEAERRLIHEDAVQLPRLYLAWPTPEYLGPADAALDALAGVLAGGKNSRLYKRLVYETAVAQDVYALQESAALASKFNVVVTARAGQTLGAILTAVDEEIALVQKEPPSARELVRFQNSLEAAYLKRLEKVGGDGGKANQLNSYFTSAGDPDYFEEDLSRYRALSPSDVRAVAQRYLGRGRIVLSVVPAGHPEMAAPGSEEAK